MARRSYVLGVPESFDSSTISYGFSSPLSNVEIPAVLAAGDSSFFLKVFVLSSGTSFVWTHPTDDNVFGSGGGPDFSDAWENNLEAIILSAGHGSVSIAGTARWLVPILSEPYQGTLNDADRTALTTWLAGFAGDSVTVSFDDGDTLPLDVTPASFGGLAATAKFQAGTLIPTARVGGASASVRLRQHLLDPQAEFGGLSANTRLRENRMATDATFGGLTATTDVSDARFSPEAEFGGFSTFVQFKHLPIIDSATLGGFDVSPRLREPRLSASATAGGFSASARTRQHLLVTPATLGGFDASLRLREARLEAEAAFGGFLADLATSPLAPELSAEFGGFSASLNLRHHGLRAPASLGGFAARAVVKFAGPIWPSDLPQLFLQSNFQSSPSNSPVSFPPDQGAPIRRRRYTRSLTYVQGEMSMSAAQWEDFKSFYLNDTESGLRQFEFPDPFSDDLLYVTLVGVPSRSRQGNGWRVSMRLRTV